MNEHLEELEQQLESIPVKKLYFIYVSMALMLVFISWNVFGEEMLDEISSMEESIQTLQKKYQKNNIKSLEKAIQKAKKESLSLQEELDTLSTKEIYIRKKLKSINFAYFNQSGTARILDDILKQSLKYEIDIEDISYTSSNERYQARIVEKDIIDMNGGASYNSIVNMLYYIDNLNALLRINSIDIYMDENQSTKFNVNFSHYGVEL